MSKSTISEFKVKTKLQFFSKKNSDVYVEVLPGLPGGTLDFIHIHFCSQVSIIFYIFNIHNIKENKIVGAQIEM